MSVALALAVGFLAARLVRLLAAGFLASLVLQRPNYREHYLPTGAGVLVAVAVVLIEGGRALAAAAGVGDAGLTTARVLVLLAVTGFALLGFLDDVVGDSSSQGFLGHGRQLAAGRLTTGGTKLVAGGALALMLASVTAGDSAGRLLVDGALIALAANLANLLDRAPGRVIKAGVVAYVPLAVVAGTGAAGLAVAPVVGCTLGLLPDDLREHLMLGDAGANALGAVLGLGAVLALGPGARTIAAAVLLALNLASEVVSFSAVIARVPPLQRLDLWGRPHH